MEAHALEILEKNVKFIIDEVLNEKRHYINKHIQNALNNYFMENYCVLTLKEKFRLQSGRQIKNIIFEKYSSETATFPLCQMSFSHQQHFELKKYYILLLGFLEEHIANETLELYRNSMLSIINAEEKEAPETNDKEQLKVWAITQWKKLIALFVLHHTYFPQFEAIYSIWFDIFQSPIIAATSQKKKQIQIRRTNKLEGLPYIIQSLGINSHEVPKEKTKQSRESLDEMIDSKQSRLLKPISNNEKQMATLSNQPDKDGQNCTNSSDTTSSFPGQNSNKRGHDSKILVQAGSLDDCRTQVLEKNCKVEPEIIQQKRKMLSNEISSIPKKIKREEEFLEEKEFNNSQRSAFQKFNPNRSTTSLPQLQEQIGSVDCVEDTSNATHLQSNQVVSHTMIPQHILQQQHQQQMFQTLPQLQQMMCPQPIMPYQYPLAVGIPQIIYIIPQNPFQYMQYH